MGSFVKTFLAQQWQKRPQQIYHVTVMPCFDKKLEATRPDFVTVDEMEEVRDVDLVLSTSEVDQLLQDQHWQWQEFVDRPDRDFDTPWSIPTVTASVRWRGSSSGGYIHHLMHYLDPTLIEEQPTALFKPLKRSTDFSIATNGAFQFATVYGFRNIQNLVRKLKQPGQAVEYAAVEVMACPSGCVNGGGQIKLGETPEWGVGAASAVAQVEAIYQRNPRNQSSDAQMALAQSLLTQWGDQVGTTRLTKMLNTSFTAVSSHVATTLQVQW